MPTRTKAIAQLLDLQGICSETATELRACEAVDRAQKLAAVSRAWTELEHLKRIMQGRPGPGSLTPAERARRQRRRPAERDTSPDLATTEPDAGNITGNISGTPVENPANRE